MSDEAFRMIDLDDDDAAALGIARGSRGTWRAWVGAVLYLLEPVDSEMVALRVARPNEPARVVLATVTGERCSVLEPLADDALTHLRANEQTTDASALAVRAAWAEAAPGLAARDDDELGEYIDAPGDARIFVWQFDGWLFGRCHETREAFARRIDTPRTTAPGGSA